MTNKMNTAADRDRRQRNGQSAWERFVLGVHAWDTK